MQVYHGLPPPEGEEFLECHLWMTPPPQDASAKKKRCLELGIPKAKHVKPPPMTQG